MLDHGLTSHPEHSSRLTAILAALKASPHSQFLDTTMSRKATVEELTQVHEASYVKYVLSLDGKRENLDQETPVTPGSVTAALVAAGLGLELVEQVLSNKIENGFALVRPPGHHCLPDAAMGFCVFNSIAIAAKKALSQGLKRILILDWDVHHGNGTQKIFYNDDRVLFIDLHQDNLFPVASGLLSERGIAKGLGYTANIPLPDSCRDDDYLYIFEQIVKPLARKYQPELILVSAGFDAHESDPLGSMSLTTAGFGALCAKTKTLAHELCNGRLVLFLEGGYNPPYLAANVMECINALVTPLTQPQAQAEIEPYTYGMKNYIEEIHDALVKKAP